MNTESGYTGREEVKRDPADASDLENGTSGHGNIANGNNDSMVAAPARKQHC
jgi:hypothetical protein